MDAFMQNPLGFAMAGWNWIWHFIATTDGRMTLVAGLVAWFVMERIMAPIYDPMLKVLAVFLVIGATLAGGIAYGGLQSSPGQRANFEKTWKTPNLQEYQQVK